MGDITATAAVNASITGVELNTRPAVSVLVPQVGGAVGRAI